MRRLLLSAVISLAAIAAQAQTVIMPGQRSSISVSGTITTGSTFQSVMASDSNRTGCTLQNTSAHTMYVYFGATASATTSNSLQIAPNGFLYCSNTGSSIALTDNVAITTSTTGDTFVAFYQH